MIVLEAAIAITFAKWGGGLARSYEPGEKLVGWLFLLAGLGVAAAAGNRL